MQNIQEGCHKYLYNAILYVIIHLYVKRALCVMMLCMKSTNQLEAYLVSVIFLSDWALPLSCIIWLISVPETTTAENWSTPTWSFVSKSSTSWQWRWIYKKGDGISYQYQLLPTMLLSHFQLKICIRFLVCWYYHLKWSISNASFFW